MNKQDLEKIGHTAFQEKGKLYIICDVETASIEEILLRDILKSFGDVYDIQSIEDFFYDYKEIPDILFKTNLPFREFENLCKPITR